jgi:hypothetical protein
MRGFDIVNIEPQIDFFNVMTYDIRECALPAMLALILCVVSNNVEIFRRGVGFQRDVSRSLRLCAHEPDGDSNGAGVAVAE